MAGRRAQPARTVPRIKSTDVDDPKTSRAIGSLASAVSKLQSTADVDTLRQDLAVGTNTVQHSLGRAFRFVAVTPTVANAAFAWAINTAGNPHPDRQVLIDVVGVDQPGALILVS